MEIYAVILNYCDEEKTKRLTNYLTMQLLINKVIIVDNCSPDGSYERLNQYFKDNLKVEILNSGENKGYSYGYNLGYQYINEHYNPDYIFSLNSDIIPIDNGLENCINFLEKHPDYAIVSPRMLDHKKNPVKNYWNFPEFRKDFAWAFTGAYHVSLLNYKYIENFEDYIQVAVVRESFLCFRNNMLKEVGYYDDHVFMYYEGNILCQKLKERDYKVALLKNETYIHDHPRKDRTLKQKLKGFKETTKAALYYYTFYDKKNFIKLSFYKICTLFGITFIIGRHVLKRFFKKLDK